MCGIWKSWECARVVRYALDRYPWAASVTIEVTAVFFRAFRNTDVHLLSIQSRLSSHLLRLSQCRCVMVE
eukprot:4306766-Lingulodinium_polyedra.AAC.1